MDDFCRVVFVREFDRFVSNYKWETDSVGGEQRYAVMGLLHGVFFTAILDWVVVVVPEGVTTTSGISPPS
jgi:hypothetical protein